ncbi:MAG: hypothetical protein WC749_04010 [Dehalococcoidia bacterium]
MPECMKLDDWLSVARKEYLQDFIKQGGAAVKFIVPINGPEMLTIRSGVQRLAEEEGFLYAYVDGATVKIHWIEQLFYHVAKQVDWDNLVYAFLRKTLQSHYKLPESRNEFNLEQIAVLNGYEKPEMQRPINVRLKEALFRDYAMTQEFRIAMITLCRHQLDPSEDSINLCVSVKEWLTGELGLVSALKRALIFQKIGRHNARNMLFSLAHWLHLSGKNGLVLVLDISRYTQDRPKERDGALYYSTPAVVDCYEVLRQFIDGTDELDFCFSVVLAPVRFLDEGDRRSVSAYDALKLRIWDEVHDKVHVNPLASLIRICSC